MGQDAEFLTGLAKDQDHAGGMGWEVGADADRDMRLSRRSAQREPDFDEVLGFQAGLDDLGDGLWADC